VSFEAGARTAWHTHPLGQTLVVTTGWGLMQQAGQPAHVIRPGDVVSIPAKVRHWHGAGPGGSMSHVAIAEREGGNSVTWQEKVSDVDYAAVTKLLKQMPHRPTPKITFPVTPMLSLKMRTSCSDR
jgi:4-carboxymuconolactone decarboxylase